MDMITIFKALSNETRLNILRWLKKPSKHFTSSHCDIEKDGVCVGLIEKKAGLSQSTISQYLALLEQAGLIIMQRSGQWTYCKINEKGLKTLLSTLKAEFL